MLFRLLAPFVLLGSFTYAQTPTASKHPAGPTANVDWAGKTSHGRAQNYRTGCCQHFARPCRARKDRSWRQCTSANQYAPSKIQPGGQKEEDTRNLPGEDHRRCSGSATESKDRPNNWLRSGRSGCRCNQEISIQASNEGWTSRAGGNIDSSEFPALLISMQAPKRPICIGEGANAENLEDQFKRDLCAHNPSPGFETKNSSSSSSRL